MSALFRNRFRSSADPDRSASATQSVTANGQVEISDGDLKYVGEQGGNVDIVAYQEASGAPVEIVSPLGYSVGPVTILFLNLSKIIGTGIFSTPASILKGTGSVGLSLIFWTLGFFTSASSLSVYLEYAAYFPSRSGSEVAYLEQAYPRPKWFFPTTFAVQTVILSFSSGNATVMANYLFAIGKYKASDWETKGLAVGCYTLAVLAVLFHTRGAYWVNTMIGGIKLITLIFISILGLVVLGGHTKVETPTAGFKNAFEGASTAYGVTNAMYKIIFAYAGYENAFNMVNETKDPIKSIKRSGFGAVLLTAILYILANVAYFAAIPKDEIIAGKTIAAGLLFTKVFGDTGAVRGLNFLIALSSFGNLVAVLLGQSRLIRECGRQGVLPFPKFWASTKPFGTPAGPYFLKWAVTVLIILAVPAGDAFSFISDLQVYPSAVFALFMAAGLYVLRFRRKRLGLPEPAFKVWNSVLIFNIATQAYLIIMPWYPPTGGATGGDVSFWYGTYIVVGIGILLGCGAYYYIYIVLLPKLKGYKVRQEVLDLGSGAQTHHLIKVPLNRVEEWDAQHDPHGRKINQLGYQHELSESSSRDEKNAANNDMKDLQNYA
ncbi:amino acid permease-domain-containing protein [Paraphoma chrysanthemicola]|uniref:Amino acid permease-domain-containing protein n=1 Tax=Paraphoma chrysanthemicola TaxID=798071 RepID=A0A8K0RFU9_9PLEO|nr:amino acid permease-domain-containing protein [Paraphoma chrysanthemicola]